MSPSHSHATSAPNSGTVAFRIDDSPVLIDSSAKLNSANGMAELIRPQIITGFQCWRSCGHSPRDSMTGSSASEAIATRSPAVGSGPNSSVPSRMNKNDAPQRAASKMNSAATAADMGVEYGAARSAA